MNDEVTFLREVADKIGSDHVVLDFGAGRGDLIGSPVVDQRLVNFRGRCRRVDGCDIDPAVLANPGLDAAAVIRSGERLPYPDNRFDIVVSRSVFEHLEDPRWAARELLRVVKPGGAIYAVTPNRWGYVAIGARMLPVRLHNWALGLLQPGRAEAVFRAHYRLNTARAARAHFSGARVSSDLVFGPPGYAGRGGWLGRAMTMLHACLPTALAPQLHLVIRKPRDQRMP